MIAIPFAVDLNKVRSVFGSNDHELLQNVRLTKMYKNYAKQMESYSYDKALEDIFTRPKELLESAGEIYGYALMAICDFLGTHLLPMCDGIYYGEDWETANGIIKASGITVNIERIFEGANVFQIPHIADFPAINCFTKEEVSLIAFQFEKIEIDETKTDFDSDAFDEVQLCLLNLKNCFKVANDNHLDIVTFMH